MLDYKIVTLRRKIIIGMLGGLLLGGQQASAQLIQKKDNEQAGSVVLGEIVGYWTGFSICGSRAWVDFHRIYEEDGDLISEYRFYGESKGGNTVDVYLSGETYLFDNRDKTYYDTEYLIDDYGLVGSAVGTKENCRYRLWPITEIEWRELTSLR